jgi:hypothetical protein
MGLLGIGSADHRRKCPVRVVFRIRWLVFQLALLAVAGQVARPQSACDLNLDGSVNVVDVQLGVNMSLGLVPCTANINGAGVCNVVTVQRVINAGLGGTCQTDSAHSVSLNWTASISPNVSGYNVYRGTSSSGPYTKVNPTLIVGTSYQDTAVQAGQTYYYVATAVDSSAIESAYSNQAPAVIPYP